MMTRHAQVRCQQRGIPPVVADWLMDFGAIRRGCRGAEVRYFDRVGKRFAQTLMREEKMIQLERLLGAYVILSSDGDVVTAGHRYKRINRP